MNLKYFSKLFRKFEKFHPIHCNAWFINSKSIFEQSSNFGLQHYIKYILWSQERSCSQNFFSGKILLNMNYSPICFMIERSEIEVFFQSFSENLKNSTQCITMAAMLWPIYFERSYLDHVWLDLSSQNQSLSNLLILASNIKVKTLIARSF